MNMILQSTMQQLLEGIGSGDGSSGVPSVVGGKRRQVDDTDSLSSSKKNKSGNSDANSFRELTDSIERHSNSIVSAAKIAAAEQAKKRSQAAAEQEKNRTQSRITEINSRINALRDSKREMALRLAVPNIHQAVMDIVVHEMKGIEEEIASNVEELNGLLLAPTKGNCSPN